jgi:acyl dehydratase
VSATASSPGPRRFADVAELVASAGEHLGRSGWLAITQDRIDQFADATGDHQWIHVDPVRAADGPFGTTIAHGYLSLALLPVLGAEIYTVGPEVTRINYGIDRARFPQPVRVGDRVRASLSLGEATASAGGTQLVQEFTVEVEGATKPALVARTVVLLVG